MFRIRSQEMLPLLKKSLSGAGCLLFSFSPRILADRNKVNGDQNINSLIRVAGPQNVLVCDKADEHHAAGTWDQSEGLELPAPNRLLIHLLGQLSLQSRFWLTHLVLLSKKVMIRMKGRRVVTLWSDHVYYVKKKVKSPSPSLPVLEADRNERGKARGKGRTRKRKKESMRECAIFEAK